MITIYDFVPMTPFTMRRLKTGCVQLLRSFSGRHELGTTHKADNVSVLRVYKDCMRLSYHVAAQSAKGEALRFHIRTAFKAQAHVSDPQEIARLKDLAVVALQNYVVYEQTGKVMAKRGKGVAKTE